MYSIGDDVMATKEEKDEFSTLMLSRADQYKIDCMECIVSYCEELGLEVETAASLVNDVLKARLEEEAMQLRYIQRSAKLPL
jgi:hypothetical protein